MGIIVQFKKLLGSIKFATYHNHDMTPKQQFDIEEQRFISFFLGNGYLEEDYDIFYLEKINDTTWRYYISQTLQDNGNKPMRNNTDIAYIFLVDSLNDENTEAFAEECRSKVDVLYEEDKKRFLRSEYDNILKDVYVVYVDYEGTDAINTFDSDILDKTSPYYNMNQYYYRNITQIDGLRILPFKYLYHSIKTAIIEDEDTSDTDNEELNLC